MTKDLVVKEVTERATDILNSDADCTGKYKITKKETDAVLKAFAECVVENISENKTEKVPLHGLGNFSAKHVAEKSGIVQLGENKGSTWHKDAEDQLVFKISKSVKTLA